MEEYKLAFVAGGVLGAKGVGTGAPVSRLEGRRWSEPPCWVEQRAWPGVAGTELIGELRAGGGYQPWRRVPL